MSVRLSILFLFLLSMFGWTPGQTAAASLYTGEAVIESGDEAVQSLRLEALDEVLTRLTGIVDRSLVEELEIGAAELRMLVLSEQRIRRPRIGPGGVDVIEQVRLQVDFDPQGVDRLLAARGLPRLGRERPAVLLWLAVEEGGDLSLDGGAELEDAIDEQARRLGLDVIRPLGDLLDLADIEAIDIRGGFLDSAEPSARRYGAGVIAMLDLREQEDDWQARWFWRLEGRDAGVGMAVDDSILAIKLGLQQVLGALVDRFGLTGAAEPGGLVRVVVGGILDEVQYAEVMRYLSSLSVVADVQVIAARDREIEFELDLASAGLEDALAIGGVLAVDGRRADGGLVLRLRR
ncbi:MAG: DUF2066 domain-containing protein [Wenzhouxiangella sp.]|nr:MAG: DUF2066 domain-containing protein [Wenzhouxiangella sp.]